MDNSNLGARMKEYEKVARTKLMRRMPVAIRLDGKAFHTFTKGFQKPFDDIFMETMQETTKYLCENIQGCVFGYTQSDEITLILTDYATFNTDAWYDNQVQKICSVSASMATLKFNLLFGDKIYSITNKAHDLPYDFSESDLVYFNTLIKAANKGAMFDSRCFNISKEEVVNLVYWRQLDATRNSILSVAQANFSFSEMQNKSCNELQEMLFSQRGINWNDLPAYKKRGTAVIRDIYGEWFIDEDMPELKGAGRSYLERLI